MTTTTKTAAHSTYRIHSATTGQHLGDFGGETEADALDAYAKDAGYADFADLLDRVPDSSSRDDLQVTEVTAAPLTADNITVTKRDSQKLTADVLATLMRGAQELGEITVPAGSVINWIDPKSGLRSGPHGERVWRFVATLDGEQNTYTACTGADVLLPVPGLKDPERFQ